MADGDVCLRAPFPLIFCLALCLSSPSLHLSLHPLTTTPLQLLSFSSLFPSHL